MDLSTEVSQEQRSIQAVAASEEQTAGTSLSHGLCIVYKRETERMDFLW